MVEAAVENSSEQESFDQGSVFKIIFNGKLRMHIKNIISRFL